jgi:hypothetical protein
MSPIVNDELVTNAELQSYRCPGCKQWFKDFILFRCEDCTKKGWYEIVLNPDWFPEKLEDGSPDWNSVKKDNPKYYKAEWSYGRLNIETMEMEKVPIHTGGKKWDYQEYQISTAIEDKKIEIEALRKVFDKKTPEEIRQEIKIEKDIEKKEKAANEEENTQQSKTTDRQEKKEQKEVFKLIDKK